MEFNNDFTVKVAGTEELKFIPVILNEIEESAKERGTGIAKRTASYLEEKINEGKAVMAFSKEGEWAGFCYIETWSNKTYVANSGLIVARKFRKEGLARMIKKFIFDYSRQQYPDAKLFGLTTGLAVMKINSNLGYKPVTYSELTQDDVFWSGCQSCVNFKILKSKERKNCLCTAMLYNPNDITASEPESSHKLFSKFKKIKTILWKK
ncbi:N-acetyltransferase [Chryseobacterium sp. 6424]|uniref:N-acetyltransferase n=1 Tax=Chryseobacterium sp. 6424 TaxID=2039166 RepID=UPI000EFAAF52|nr:N-acetyltransferase [Chryseobacterium sp. 6424]